MRTEGWRPEARSQRLEAGGQKPEARSWKLDRKPDRTRLDRTGREAGLDQKPEARLDQTGPEAGSRSMLNIVQYTGQYTIQY